MKFILQLSLEHASGMRKKYLVLKIEVLSIPQELRLLDGVCSVPPKLLPKSALRPTVATGYWINR
jgi:hypothetical protein